jgi:hypothetical protein
MVSERPHMMGNEVLGALHDPGQVADAEFINVAQCCSNRQPSGIGERPRSTGSGLGCTLVEAAETDAFRGWQIEAEKVAAVIAHTNGR